MKKCLCISGQIRSWNLVKNNWFDNFLNINDVDVFFHFWHNSDNSYYVTNRGNGVVDVYGDVLNEHLLGRYGDYDISDILNSFKPKSFQIEHPLDPSVSNTNSMFHSIQRCNNLKNNYERDHNFKYDLVIRSRFDLLFTEPVIIQEINNNTLYVKNRPGGCGGLNDWFAYGDSYVMDLYSNIINHLDNYNLEGNCAEGVIGQIVSKNGLDVSYISDNFSIIRNNGNMVI